MSEAVWISRNVANINKGTLEVFVHMGELFKNFKLGSG